MGIATQATANPWIGGEPIMLGPCGAVPWSCHIGIGPPVWIMLDHPYRLPRKGVSELYVLPYN